MTPYKNEDKINNKKSNKNTNIENDKNKNIKEKIIFNNEIQQLDQEILNLKSKITQINKK